VPPVPTARTTRRTTIGVGLLALGGCTVDSGTRTSRTSQPSVLGDQEYDQRLVDEAAQEIAAALKTIERIAARFEPVAGSLAQLVALHHAHLSALGVVSPPALALAPLPADVSAALTRLGTLEERLQRELASVAENARSGSLARLLAGMSAGVQQHVVALFPIEVA